VRNPEAERFVRRVWADFQKEGIPGVLALPADDARWAPHSAHSRRFRTTAEYRAQLERQTEQGERVEASGVGMWSHDDVVVVRGLLREVGRDDPVLAREAFIALHRDAGL
jgi:hypothetical protein